jgi:hypothetical protein
MVPGDGPLRQRRRQRTSTFDMLAALERCVESERALDTIPASRVVNAP